MNCYSLTKSRERKEGASAAEAAVEVNICNLSTWGAEAAGLQVQDWPRLYKSNPNSENQNENKGREEILSDLGSWDRDGTAAYKLGTVGSLRLGRE